MYMRLYFKILMFYSFLKQRVVKIVQKIYYDFEAYRPYE